MANMAKHAIPESYENTVEISEGKSGKKKSGARCLECGERSALRSHRRGWFEHLRSRMTGKVPFRCMRCKKRFWKKIKPEDM